ncbi:MAG: hydantoinase B/oxoprolinase family protein [Alphaproteobacteria bacterium]
MGRNYGTIDRDIFQHQVVGIAEEMSRALRRTAYSSIIWDMYDYACAIFTTEGELLAQAQTIPAQLGTMSTALEYMRTVVPLEEWQPGDVLICNDPYKGCTHTPDITIFSPVFSRGELVAVTSTIAHHIDIGGKVPCTTQIDNVEVFGEGLIFPPTRLMAGGKPVQVVFDFISSNVRSPRACIGDLRAQIAGCRTAERRLEDLAGRYGNGDFRQLAAECLDYGERYARGVLAQLPDGRHEAEILMEDGIAQDEHIRIKVAVEIAGDAIKVDFSGTDDQRACALNCPWSSTVSLTTYAIKCLTAPEIPQNEGFNRPISLTAPLGSLLNPRRPAAVGSRHFAQQAVADVVLKALAPLVPERSAAGCQISFPVWRAGGVDDRPSAKREAGRPKNFVIMDIIGGGMGGSAAADGMNAIDTHAGNCGILSAEVMETFSPVRVRQTRLVPGSGGAGRQRGGLAVERDYEILSETALVSCQRQQANDETAPWGAEGGAPGGKAIGIINPDTEKARELPARFRHHTLHRGDIMRMRSAGGGGYGDPAERSPEALAHDRAEGYA